MGGRSTSQGAVLRDGKTQMSSGFDLHSWQGLTEVLKVGKESLTDPSAYAEFRNLVLHYAQQGGDVELRKRIDAITATFTKTSFTGATEETIAPSHAPMREATTSESREETPVRETRKAPDIGTRRIAPQFKKTIAQKPVPLVVEKKREGSEVAPPPPRKPVEVTPVVTQPLVAEQTPQTYKSLEEYRARIGVIKRFVNAHIGNPATLIDTHNALGKKYMTALLAALKATGGGGTPDVDAAMANLEAAYLDLVNDLKREPEPTPEPVPIVQKEETIEETTTPEPIVERQAVKEPKPVLPTVSESVPPPREEVPPPPPKPVSSPKPVKKYSAAKTLASLLVDEQPSVEPAPRHTPLPEASIQSTMPEPLLQANAVWNSQGKHAIRGIGKREQDTIKRESGVDPAQVAVKQTELGDPQITASLRDLLHEWSIFKNSGFFGIGPAGAEHPLYLQLSGLTMGEVIAGRWEGADPKITKVIKQYVDAWRHEQGIAYTVNETFEHYLRRVVQRILKRQNG